MLRHFGQAWIRLAIDTPEAVLHSARYQTGWTGSALAARTAQLLHDQAQWVRTLSLLPRTLWRHEAAPANLFAHGRPDGQVETEAVAVDRKRSGYPPRRVEGHSWSDKALSPRRVGWAATVAHRKIARTCWQATTRTSDSITAG